MPDRHEAAHPTGESPLKTGTTLGELFSTFEPGLRRYTRSLAQDTDLADDLVQEAFIQAMQHLDLLGRLNEYQQRAWLFKVAKNRFIDHQRAQTRQQSLLAYLADNASYALAREDNYVMSAFIAQHHLSDRIPEHYRGLLEKRYLLGMTSQEIGQEMHIPDATVRSRLRLAINWLRSHQNELF